MADHAVNGEGDAALSVGSGFSGLVVAGKTAVGAGAAGGMAGLAGAARLAVAQGEGVGESDLRPGGGIVALRALALEVPGRSQRFMAGCAVGGVSGGMVEADTAPRSAGVGVAQRALASIMIRGTLTLVAGLAVELQTAGRRVVEIHILPRAAGIGVACRALAREVAGRPGAGVARLAVELQAAGRGVVEIHILP